MLFQNRFSKIILILIIAGVLSLFLGLFYNQNRKTLAQEIWPIVGEEEFPRCEQEVPIGQIIDKIVGPDESCRGLSLNILTAMEITIDSAVQQLQAAQELFNLPAQCSGNRCFANCEACPWNAISNKVEQIEKNYEEIEFSKKVIEGEMGRRGEITATLQPREGLLGKARIALENCVIPSKNFVEGEIGGAWLISCKDLKYYRLETGVHEECQWYEEKKCNPHPKSDKPDEVCYGEVCYDEIKTCETCYPSNFFCCRVEFE